MHATRRHLGVFGLAAAGVLSALTWATWAPAADKADPKPAALASQIDQIIAARLKADSIEASPRADDAEFLRRAYLDITGVIPPADKVVAFLDSKDPQKRSKLIDELLASDLYGRHMADIWQGMLLPKNSDNRRLQTAPLLKWLRDGFNQNKPWNEMVTELLTATGASTENGAAVFWVANPTPDKINDSVARLFMGVQLQCAQCHNHPFTHWKQDEYWGMAAFFMKVRMDGNARKDGTAGISESGKGRPPMLPEAAKKLPAKFFQGEEPKLDASEPYRPVFAKWLTSPENPFFAKAMANRMWAHFFGRGIVNPVDDIQPNNPATHPELLDELAKQFKADGFDVKNLIRAICSSDAYQRTSKPQGNNESDSLLYSHVAVKPLSPEQLFDSLDQVIGRGSDVRPAAARKQQQQPRGQPANARAQFVAFFEADEGADPTEYQAGIPQALRLMNSPQLNRGAVLLDEAFKKGSTPAERIELLYLGTLSRRPSTAETDRLTEHLGKASSNDRTVYSDILWALLNSSEFTLNH
jgi:hypothetical protein